MVKHHKAALAKNKDFPSASTITDSELIKQIVDDYAANTPMY